MGLFNILKKRSAPKELPSLALPDPIMNNKMSTPNPLVMEKAFTSQLTAFEQAQFNAATQKYKPLPIQSMAQTNEKGLPKAPTNQIEKLNDKSFFKELIKDLTEEVNSDKLDSKYKEKILSDDIISQMKNYWEQQKPEVFLQNAGGELKNKLMEKAEKLTSLERDWQGAYFNLIAKEEKIRQEEKELKQMLSELISIYETSLVNRTQNKTTAE